VGSWAAGRLDRPVDGLTYQGTHWNRLGGPIQIKSADKGIKTLPATETFNDTYAFTGFGPKAPNPCASDLTATQDNTTRTIGLGSDPGEKVLFADGITLADGTTPAAGDVLCQGWNLGVHHTGYWSLVTDVTGVTGGLLFPFPTSSTNPAYIIASTNGTCFGVKP
jgi:hypothetical protein